MNHKRKRPKNARSGCLMCKHWKVNGKNIDSKDSEQISSKRSRQRAKQEVNDFQAKSY